MDTLGQSEFSGQGKYDSQSYAQGKEKMCMSRPQAL